MKTFVRLVVFTLLVTIFAGLVSAFAQESPAQPPVPVDTAWITQLIGIFTGKFGVVAQIFGVIVGFRAVFKPGMTWLHGFVKTTPTTRDDEILALIEGNIIFRWFAWGLDYVFSIKLTGHQ